MSLIRFVPDGFSLDNAYFNFSHSLYISLRDLRQARRVGALLFAQYLALRRGAARWRRACAVARFREPRWWGKRTLQTQSARDVMMTLLCFVFFFVVCLNRWKTKTVVRSANLCDDCRRNRLTEGLSRRMVESRTRALPTGIGKSWKYTYIGRKLRSVNESVQCARRRSSNDENIDTRDGTSRASCGVFVSGLFARKYCLCHTCPRTAESIARFSRVTRRSTVGLRPLTFTRRDDVEGNLCISDNELCSSGSCFFYGLAIFRISTRLLFQRSGGMSTSLKKKSLLHFRRPYAV